MGKDTRLINIYLKIHNKKTLTMDDLKYLAEYDPECFEKTCKNVVYNIPEVKPIMEPDILDNSEIGQALMPLWNRHEYKPLWNEPESRDYEWQNISKVLENLKRLEINELPIEDIDADRVKNLLGNLYMELLFPHNDKYAFVNMEDEGNSSSFDKRA
ncbi:MAG: hypothetical protein NC433_03845 [Clostridiales bacterium]|nr:hypothetical protein [Clostridiales bacterium]